MAHHKSKILTIYTGGTLGMSRHDEGTFDPKVFAGDVLKYVPDVRHLADIDFISPFKRDSSNIGIEQWIQIADLIENNYHDYDGVVIIHGTDTLCYSASALSYMLENPPIPIILTGSQRPLSMIRTDARANLTDAYAMISLPLKDVMICFDHHLFRGNRCKKISTSSYDAIASMNYPPLATSGTEIELLTTPFHSNQPFCVHRKFDNRIATIKLSPSCLSHYFDCLLDHSDTQIFIIEAFGAGNIPIDDEKILKFIKRARQMGRGIVIGTACSHGSTNLTLYESGKRALAAGAISSEDLTFEACVTKLMFLLGRYDGNVKATLDALAIPLAGELTTTLV